MGMVWNYSLDNYLNSGISELLYEFDPTYVDECHPNYPDCVTGQNGCINCLDSHNPILMVSGKVVTYSHQTDVLLTDVTERPDVDEAPFALSITPNPVKNTMTLTTDYEKGSVRVHILNTQGVQVRNFSMKGSATLDVSDLPSGLYFVYVIGGEMISRKVVIQK